MSKKTVVKRILLFSILLLLIDVVLAYLKIRSGERCSSNHVISIVVLLSLVISLYVYLKTSTNKHIWVILVGIFFAFSNYNILFNLEDFIGYYSGWDFGDLSFGYIDMYVNTGFDKSNYPPFAVLIYRLANMFVSAGRTKPEWAHTYFVSCFLLISCMIMGFSIIRILRNIGIYESLKEIYLMALFLTGPFLYAFERANVILLSFAFILLFIAMKDSDSRAERWISYIALTLAAEIKLYPAVFGILLIKRGRIKDCLMVFALGVVSFLAPFLWQADGNIVQSLYLVKGFFESLSDWTKEAVGLFDVSQSIQGLLAKVPAFNDHAMWIYSAIVLFIILTIVGICLTDDEECMSLLLFGLCWYIPKISLWYNMVFILIPFILFVGKINKQERITDYIKMIMYILLLVFMWRMYKLDFLIPYNSAWRFAILWVWNYIEILNVKFNIFEKIRKETICLRERVKQKLAK